MKRRRITPTERVVETALAYYCQGEALAKNATKAELVTWFAAFSDEAKAALIILGPDKWCTLASLKRYLLEARGYFMRDYMFAHLTSNELRYWVDDGGQDIPVG